jgi:hypothetical protein
MWEVSKVAPQNGGWGFNIVTTQGKKPLVSFAYKTEAEAKQAAAKVWPVIANAISVTLHVIVR